jgi:hypothetical protein
LPAQKHSTHGVRIAEILVGYRTIMCASNVKSTLLNTLAVQEGTFMNTLIKAEGKYHKPALTSSLCNDADVFSLPLHHLYTA